MAANMWSKDKRNERTLERNPELLKGWQTEGICYRWGVEVNVGRVVNTSSQAMFCDEETRTQFDGIVSERTILHASVVGPWQDS